MCSFIKHLFILCMLTVSYFQWNYHLNDKCILNIILKVIVKNNFIYPFQLCVIIYLFKKKMHDNISSIFGNSETRARQCIVNANLFLITANYICLIISYRLSGRKPMKLQPDYWFTFEGSHQLIVFLYWVICTFIAIVIHFAHFVNMIIINKQFSLAFFFHPSKS